MANTNLTIFYVVRGSTSWELVANKLLIVEDIAAYLLTKPKITFTDFQYIKNELELSINVEISQSYSQPKAATSYKYVAIQNSGELVHYYFVKKAVWRSKTCVRLELVMDVLNTFQEGTDYDFKGNTRIIREHKDRFVKKSSATIYDLKLVNANDDWQPQVNNIGYLSDSPTQGARAVVKILEVIDIEHYIVEVQSGALENYTEGELAYMWNSQEQEAEAIYGNIVYEKENTIFRNIDYISEGIAPTLIHKSEGTLIENNKSLLACDWYLLYRNQNDPSDSLVNPVDCYLIPENETNTNAAYISNGRIIPSWVEEGKYYYFSVAEGQTYTLSNGAILTYASYSGPWRILLITKAGNKLTATFMQYWSNEETEVFGFYDDLDYIDVSLLPALYNKKSTFVNVTYNNLYSLTFPESFTNSDTYSKLDPISLLDKTDAKNIKLIKLPYCPFDFIVSSNYLEVGNNWDYVSLTQSNGGIINCLKLNNLNTKLEANLKVTNQPLGILKDLDVSSPSITDLRKSIIYESKLYHSDFYRPTYVYDSFAFYIKLEACKIDYYVEDETRIESLDLKFNMTSTINSKFMFTFVNYSSDKADQNYYNVLPIARNNEVVLYNVPYINYIRNGYNYDVKNKNIALASNITGLGLSGISIGASLLLPSAPLKIAGVVASLVSMAMSVKNAVVSSIQNENSIKEKINSAQNQATSVVGSDDVDLMSEYADNRLKYIEYEPSDLMKNMLFDLFFYAGYNSGRIGLPNHETRINFDYLECEASIQEITSIPEDCLAELIGAFKNGVTYLHKTSRTGAHKWDFDQKYENWEVSLMEE